MKTHCFIWMAASNTTDNYHNNAGVVIFANSLEEARKIYLSGEDGRFMGEDSYFTVKTDSEILIKDPDTIIDLKEAKGAFIFQDAGCC